MSELIITEIINSVKQNLGGSVREEKFDKKIIKITVEKDALIRAAKLLRERGFDHVKGVTGVDLSALKPPENAFEVMYHLGSYTVPELGSIVLTISTKIPRDNPELSSLTSIWPSCEYHERETYEMFGIVFTGHPNLRRLLLPEWWSDIPPLRKDYKPPGR
ncbi:MAG: NADH-quinone oxidoreductase subunit C [Nitrososphaerota archaeon]